jgi:hypothetical protein
VIFDTSYSHIQSHRAKQRGQQKCAATCAASRTSASIEAPHRTHARRAAVANTAPLSASVAAASCGTVAVVPRRCGSTSSMSNSTRTRDAPLSRRALPARRSMYDVNQPRNASLVACCGDASRGVSLALTCCSMCTIWRSDSHYAHTCTHVAY